MGRRGLGRKGGRWRGRGAAGKVARAPLTRMPWLQSLHHPHRCHWVPWFACAAAPAPLTCTLHSKFLHNPHRCHWVPCRSSCSWPSNLDLLQPLYNPDRCHWVPCRFFCSCPSTDWQRTPRTSRRCLRRRTAPTVSTPSGGTSLCSTGRTRYGEREKEGGARSRG